MSNPLSHYFESGVLLHPYSDSPNSIDLFQAVSRLSGAHKVPQTERSRELGEGQ